MPKPPPQDPQGDEKVSRMEFLLGLRQHGISDAAVLRGRRFGNLVLAASPEPLPVDALTRRTAGDPMPGRVVYGADLKRFTAGAKAVTDAIAVPSPAAPPDAFAY